MMEAEKSLGFEEFPPLISPVSLHTGEKGGKGSLSTVEDKTTEVAANNNISTSDFGSKGGNGENPNPKNWRSIFPNPRIVPNKPGMKFTPPIEVNGKIQVAARTDSFAAGLKKCENMVVGFFVGKRLSFAALHAAVNKLWKFKKEVIIKLYGNSAFIFEFNDDEDRIMLLDTGSFNIGKNLFIMRPWTQLLEKSISEIQSVPIWVRIYGVPLHMWNNEGLGLISSYLGIPLFADDCTIKQDRLAYARVCVEIDLNFSYPACIPLLIDGKVAMDLPVEYQWKAPKCDACMVFGHTTLSCSKISKTRWTPKKTKVIQIDTRADDLNGGKISEVNGDLVAPGSAALEGNMALNEATGMKIGATVMVDADSTNGTGLTMIVEQIASGASCSQVSKIAREGNEGTLCEFSITKESTSSGGSDAIVDNVGMGLVKEKNVGRVVESTGKQDKKLIPSLSKFVCEKKVAGPVKPIQNSTSRISGATTTGEQISEKDAHGEWIAAKGKKPNKLPSPKKNPFIMLSDFPFKSSSRFPIDSRNESNGGITPSRNRFQLEEYEVSEDLEDKDNNECLEDKLNKLERDSKMKERELHRLHWDGKHGITNDKEQLGRGCRTKSRK